MKNYRVWGEIGTDIDDATIDQMNKVMSLDNAIQGALMPDAHLGYGMPIGGVVALEGAISPGFVGYDIACRMHMTVLDISPEEAEKDKSWLAQSIRNATQFGVGARWQNVHIRDHPIMYDSRWDALPDSVKTLTFKDGNQKILKDIAQEQLGTSGSGNHFVDLVIGEWLRPLQEADGRKQFVALLSHSGSRGAGWNVAAHYMEMARQWESEAIGKGYGYLPFTSELAHEYWMAMNLFGDYARANHELIHASFLSDAQLGAIRTFDNHHNFAWQDGNRYIHRKGATPAGQDEYGIIPGTSATKSYLVKGLGNDASLKSSSHGAGRIASRKQAKKDYDAEAFSARMKEMGILHYGVAHDETWMAYKDIDRVMELQADLVQPVAVMSPIVVVMGG